ncbi:origin recognition complex subunit 4 isoform X2 [Rhodnius prolixus]|uniref:origin recognition complex subunit 4 isoform X2 n=1 Tax=Rhodnius prolixus TaxID=13249 RepID=UPI003D18D1E2
METNSGIHIKKVYAARELLKKNIIINSKLRGYVDQKRQIYNIIKRTVFYSESDSLLLVSPRGCGKTTLVSSCLNDLEVECGGSDDYIVIHLNGLVHTDDNLALKDIIQQLHVEELDGDRISGSFSDNLFFVLQSLRSGDRTTSKAVIFILDEFHYFCNHRNQTLLYNLFDVAQSAQAPICVIGLTTRIDITEMLEKRVKSRFSHRQLSVISKISEENPFITEEIVEEVIGNYRDARVELLKDLSILEFCLIIAMSHHNEIYDEEPFNFEMIFKRYNKFARQNSTSQIIQRPILLKGFERLAELELIMPINSGNKAFKREYQLHNLLVTKTQVKDAANSYIGLPTDVAQWASSSLFSL